MSLPENFRKVLEQIAVKNGFKEFTLNIMDPENKGFICELKNCEIVEEGRSLRLICKYLPENREHCEKYEAYSLFLREVLVYSRILPEFVKLQDESGITDSSKGFQGYPKCYISNFVPENFFESLIVLEDLEARNFKIKSIFGFTDFEHNVALFKELGKFHGLGYALKKKKPDEFQYFQGLQNRICGLMSTDAMKHFAPRNVKLASEVLEDPILKIKILRYKNNLWEKVIRVLEKFDPFNVIVHGDFWINNILYRYDESGNVKEVNFIDWQHCFCGNPAIDILTYLMTCIDSKQRHIHKSDFLEIYHKSLSEVLEDFGLDAGEIFTLRNLKDQLKKYGIYGFAISTFAYPIKYKLSEELIADHTIELSEEERENFENFKSEIHEMINDCVNYEFI